MEQPDPHAELLELVSEFIGVNRDKLSDDKSLFHDFGVAGIDGCDLLLAIGKKFDIDMSEVCWVRYFGEELPYNPLFHIWHALQGRRLDEGIVRLTIADLKHTLAKGEWIEPID